MPLVRYEIQNEYSLGAMELYGGGSAGKDDPKSILDGVAVAGLVGVLRQLGDLAEFAAGVFHDLQEQVVATSSRSHKIMVRVQHMEQVLPHLEKVVFSQTEHIHFAYTAGSDWHPNYQIKECHFLNGDLPPFIMDSFEECRGPPSLHMLDKFDIGGPGACLKRYSDPSFFRRAISTCSENSQGEKKARRSNKNGARQRNIAVAHPMTMFQQNGRMQFTSPITSQKSYTARTNSTSGSDLEDRSTSLDSRRSDYDLDFEMRSCTSDDGKEQHIFTSSPLQEQCEDMVGSVHHCQKNGHGIDLSQHNEERVSDSSCVTWDEKTEILKSPSQSNIINEHQKTIPHLMPEFCEQIKLKSEAVATDDCNSDRIMSYDENMHESQSDEDESESGDYMDALNTTASDIDTDAERRTKIREDLKNNINRGKCMLSEITSQSSTSVDVQPYMILETQDISNFPERTDLAKEQNVIHNNSDYPDVTHLHNVPREKIRKTSSGGSLSSDSIVLDAQTSSNEDAGSSLCNPQGSLTEPSRRSSINLWTNGVLLGLEPSKPPDFNALDSAKQHLLPVTNTDEHDLSGHRATRETHLSQSTRKLDNPVVTSETAKNPIPKVAADLPVTVNFNAQDQLVNDSGNSVRTIDPYAYSTSGSDKQGNVFRDKSLSSFPFPKAKLDESKDSVASSNFNNAFGSDLTDARVLNRGNNLQTLPDVRQSFKEINQDAKASSSSMFLPSYKLLANSFQKKASLSYDDTATPQPQRTVGNEASMHLKDGSPINSTASSPPLEHMRISFYPDGTSTLKLKFHDGRPLRDNDKDVLFPSFQLLPESVIQLNDISFESDGDTFSRSTEYMSDELLSEISESGSDQWACKETSQSEQDNIYNSQQWECKGTPQCEDTDIYDALRRVSSDESISRSSEFEEGKYGSFHGDSDLRSPLTENGIPCDHDFVINPPNEKNMHIMLQIPHEPMLPPPPPLPPLQWRMTKPQEDLVDDKQEQTPEVLTYQNIERDAVFDMPQQPETTVPRQQFPLNESTISTPQKKKHEDLKFSAQEVAEQPQIGNSIVEKEDFLHQIRSKSLSLKRTTISRPAFTSGPVSDMKVTAIIQKANAIRQAFVGSDEEDSDDWSDS